MKYLEMNKGIKAQHSPTIELYKSCLKSEHPSVHICEKEPKTKNAIKLHKIIKDELKKIKRRKRRHDKVSKALRGQNMKNREKIKAQFRKTRGSPFRTKSLRNREEKKYRRGKYRKGRHRKF